MAISIADEVQSRVEAAMQSPEIQARIEQRLREQRAHLEQQVSGRPQVLTRYCAALRRNQGSAVHQACP